MTARLDISADAFRSNIHVVTARIAPAELMVVMKDDAYGHGLDWAVSEAVSAGAGWLGSYDVTSALRMRELAPSTRIFAWAPSDDDEVAAAIAADIDLGVGSIEYLLAVRAQASRLGRPARVHLKIDTGLHRNGIRAESWRTAVDEARAGESAGDLAVTGLWSHLAEASDAEDDASQRIFHDALGVLRSAGIELEHHHLTASAASWERPELRGSLCRIGAFCYGVRSADGPELEGIRPVATLHARVLETDADAAVIGIGSLDGIPSTLVGASVGTPQGMRTVLEIGPTTMRIAGWPGAEAGQEVVVFGEGGASATDLAERVGTVGEEILTRVSPLIPRRHR